MGKYTYVGSGDNTCRRCKPVLSASYLSKEALLEAVGTSDAFEADILSMLKALTLAIATPSRRLLTFPSNGSAVARLLILLMPKLVGGIGN